MPWVKSALWLPVFLEKLWIFFCSQSLPILHLQGAANTSSPCSRSLCQSFLSALTNTWPRSFPDSAWQLWMSKQNCFVLLWPNCVNKFVYCFAAFRLLSKAVSNFRNIGQVISGTISKEIDWHLTKSAVPSRSQQERRAGCLPGKLQNKPCLSWPAPTLASDNALQKVQGSL